MKNFFKYILSALLSVVLINANAQQDAQFSQYMYNSLYLNPGNAGIEGNPRFTAFHRSQWVSYGDGAPNTQLVTASLPILFLKGGIGIQLQNDVVTGLRNIDLQLSYSYHLSVMGGKLGLGVRSGLFSKSNNNVYVSSDPYDDVVDNLNNQSVSGLNPDFAIGTFYYHNKWYAGLSINHLGQFKFKDVYTQARNHSYLTAGYNLIISPTLTLTPSVLCKYDFTNFSSEYSVKATYLSKFWLGLSFRQQDAIIPFVGFSILKNNALSIGYAYDYTLINSNAKSRSSHEIMLIYQLPKVVPIVKPVIRTPRYRF